MPDLPAPRLAGGLWCGEVLTQLDGYLDNILDTAARAAIEAHLASCDQCARFGGHYGALVERLRTRLGAPSLNSSQTQRLDAILATAIDD